MKIYRSMPLIAAFALGLVFQSGANAQSFGKAFEGMGDNNAPIQIEADRLEIIDNQNTALLTGNVSVVQGKTLLKASRIKVFYLREGDKTKSSSGVRQIEASGTVAIRSDDNYATADSAIVDMVKEHVTLKGDVRVSQGGNILKGCTMTVNLKTNVANVKPCEGRVIILLNRNNSQ